MSRPTTPTLPARLATGDWVVLARADQGPLGFLGKVTDGEWDRRDDALLRARVETTRSKPLWFAAGDLDRVEPSDEADLVAAALERGLVPAERATRLRSDVEALRERRLTFVRSPGLLDRLWAALPIDPEQRSGGLAAFFDEGRRVLHDLTYRRHHALVPTPVSSPASTSTPVPRVQTHEEAVVRILEALRFAELWQVRVRLLGDGPLETSDGSARDAVLQGLLTAEPSLPALLEALPEGTLEDLRPLLGFPDLRAGKKDRATLAAQLCGILRKPARRTPVITSPAAKRPPSSPAGVRRPETHQEAVARILDALRFEELCGVRIRLVGPGFVGGPTSRRASEHDAVLTASPSLPALLEALPAGTLEDLLPVLGLPELRADAEVTLAQQLCRALGPPQAQPASSAAPRVQTQVPVRPLPPTTLADATQRILGVVRGPQLPGLCDRLGVPRPVWSDPGQARDDIVAAARPIRQLVEALPPRTIAHVPFALGLPKVAGTEAEIAAAVVERLERLLPAADHLRLLLGVVLEGSVAPLVRDLGAPQPASDALEDQLAALLVADVTPCDLLAALQPTEVARAIQRFGVDGAPDPHAALRALLAPPSPPSRPSPPSAVPWPGETRAVRRLLALVHRRELLGLCERLGKPFLGSPTAVCQQLAESVGMAELLAALPPEAAPLAPRVLEPTQGPDLTPEQVLTLILVPTDLGRRANLVATLGSEAHGVSAASDLARQLLAGGHGLREVLGYLDDAQLATAAAACGLPTHGEPPTWLHAAILLLLESQPEAQ